MLYYFRDSFRRFLSKLAARHEQFVIHLAEDYLLDKGKRPFNFKDIVFWPLAKLISKLFGTRAGTQVIPLNVSMEARSRVLSRADAMKLVRSASSINITECYCRTHAKNCDAPTDNCIWFGEPILLDRSIQQVKRNASHEEVEKILIEAEKAGLIHQTVFFPDPDTVYCICNCCPCCCISFQASRQGYNVMQKSPFVVSFDGGRCIECGKCVSVCHFSAINLNHGIHVNPESCYGCGLCVSACPEGILKLIPRDDYKTEAKNKK
ncbi:MAG: 4Fe-4S binding protein [Candidatus Eremiobacteraeota bacterium]|nr:4Fe-4S binding protein [Candidatus Eremiobacteraeota bacterium]